MKSFKEFYAKFPIDYANCLSRSDQFKAYEHIAICDHRLCEKKEGETNIVESFNNVLRQRLSRLVRKGCSFSKSREMHEIVLRGFIQGYNEEILSVDW